MKTLAISALLFMSLASCKKIEGGGLRTSPDDACAFGAAPENDPLASPLVPLPDLKTEKVTNVDLRHFRLSDEEVPHLSESPTIATSLEQDIAEAFRKEQTSLIPCALRAAFRAAECTPYARDTSGKTIYPVARRYGLNALEYLALQFYTESGYEGMNSSLFERDVLRIKHYTAEIYSLASALNKLPDVENSRRLDTQFIQTLTTLENKAEEQALREGMGIAPFRAEEAASAVLYRGAFFYDSQIRTIVMKKRFHLPAFTSTSYAATIGKERIQNALVRIHRHHSGRQITTVTAVPREFEVLFKPGTPVKVRSVTLANRKTFFREKGAVHMGGKGVPVEHDFAQCDAAKVRQFDLVDNFYLFEVEEE